MTLSVCCHPKILLPWQRDVTTSSLYLQRSCPSDLPWVPEAFHVRFPEDGSPPRRTREKNLWYPGYKRLHHAFIIIFERRHTVLIMASLNVFVKLLPSSPFRLLFLHWRSPLPFCLLFLFPSLKFLGYARGKYLVFQTRDYRLARVRHSVRSNIFSRSVFSVLFPFCLQYFLTLFFALVDFVFNAFLVIILCSRSRDFSLTRESNSLSDYWRVRLLFLEPRLSLYCPRCTTLSFRLQFPSLSISF